MRNVNMTHNSIAAISAAGLHLRRDGCNLTAPLARFIDMAGLYDHCPKVWSVDLWWINHTNKGIVKEGVARCLTFLECNCGQIERSHHCMMIRFVHSLEIGWWIKKRRRFRKKFFFKRWNEIENGFFGFDWGSGIFHSSHFGTFSTLGCSLVGKVQAIFLTTSKLLLW